MLYLAEMPQPMQVTLQRKELAVIAAACWSRTWEEEPCRDWSI